MENQDNFIYDEEYAVDPVETQEDVTMKETVEIIDVSEIEVVTVELDEAFTALGESNEQLKHTLLNGKELPDQHPITAITGLRDELDGIEALKTVYSNNKNYANYYMWQDENPLQENREGFFVSLCPTTNKIKICDFNEDTEEVSEVFGITVNSAGFIGGQDDVARDTKYGLVVYSGVAMVRCASDVSVGDYVMPNRYGVAEKAVCSVVNNTGTTIEVDGKCGYLVVALDDTSGTSCAEIIFNVSAKQLNNLENSIHEFNVRIDNTEKNITSAINVANEAYHLASNLGDIGRLNDETIEKANDALEKAEEALGETASQSQQIAMAKQTSEEAKAIAQLTSTSAEAIRNEAVATANDALAKTNDLIDSLEPITTWSDEDGNTGATYFVEYINDGVATKVDIEAVSTLTDELTLEIRKNAKGLQTLVSHVDKYSLGEFSQAYGLTLQQAQSILDSGMIYVPTVDHTEQYEGSTYSERIFQKGYAYRWNSTRGTWTTITTSPCVTFSTEYIAGNNSSAQFWVVESSSVTYEDITYSIKTLYMWQDGRWIAVASLKDNVNNRINSMLAQTTNSISAEITNARGSYSGLDMRLGDIDSKINLTTFWKDPTNNMSNLAAVQLNSDDDSSNLALVVMGKEGDQQISGASIVLGQDGANPYISLDADYINLEGFTTINNSFTIDESGYMRVTGGTIGGFTLANGALYTKGRSTIAYGYEGIHISESGISVASKGSSSYFHANVDQGEVVIKGDITATSGAIAGWNLDPHWYSCSVLHAKFDAVGTGMAAPEEEGYSQGFPAFWAGYSGDYKHPYASQDAFWGGATTEKWQDKTKFYVTHAGTLYATGANISGTITATQGNFSDSVTIGGTTITAGYLRNLYNYAVGGTGTAIKQINATQGYVGGFYIDDYSIRNNRPAFKDNATTNKNGIYITANKDSSGYGGISLGSYNANQNIYYDQYIYAGRHVITGCGGSAYSQTTLRYNGLSFNYSTTEIPFNSDSTGYVGSIIVNSNRVELDGTWWGTSDNPITSDINKKNTISGIDEKYEILFDGLESRTYKYNNGTSGRLHTGFIAQQVKDALDKADIDTSEFAGLVIQNDPDGSEHWGLRYGEFVSLNTWQIQKLKKRVAELEAKLGQKEI